MGRRRITGQEQKQEKCTCDLCGRKFWIRVVPFGAAVYNQGKEFCGGKFCRATPEQRENYTITKVERRLR